MLRRIFLIILCLGLLILPVRADGGGKYAALTFDDGPSGRFTRRLLDGLHKRNAKATFLLCGYRLEIYPEEAKRILAEGHEIGIHGYSHDCMCPMTEKQVAEEIRKTDALLPEGCCPVFLRPPGGNCSEAVMRASEETGLGILSWSVDPKDWATRDTGEIITAAVKRTQDGDIILMHDMTDSSVTAALEIIDILSARGFEFVTVSELAALRGVSIQPGESYCKFP